MNINPINSVRSFSFGNAETSVMDAENRTFANSFRRMMQSPVYDDGMLDADEMAFRRGVEDFGSETFVRTKNNNIDNWVREELAAAPETVKTKPASIVNADQARNVEKFIAELDLLKMSNPQEAFSIGGQISRLKSMLRRYYQSIGKSVKL